MFTLAEMFNYSNVMVCFHGCKLLFTFNEFCFIKYDVRSLKWKIPFRKHGIDGFDFHGSIFLTYKILQIKLKYPTWNTIFDPKDEIFLLVNYPLDKKCRVINRSLINVQKLFIRWMLINKIWKFIYCANYFIYFISILSK